MEEDEDCFNVKFQISRLLDSYWSFLAYVEEFGVAFENRHYLASVKRQAMKDFTNFLLSLHMGRRIRELDVRILNALNLGCNTQAQIAKQLGVTERTIKNYFPDLKAKGLIKTKKHVGTELTKKGKRAIRT